MKPLKFTIAVELTFGVTKDDGSKLTLSEKALNYGVSALIICWFIYHATHVL